jgi:hypothetical protein
MTWPEFAIDLKKLGYEIKFADPGAGAVLGLDRLGEGFVLTTEGNWPQDFVGPIEAWIAEQRSGAVFDRNTRNVAERFTHAKASPRRLATTVAP